MGGTDKLKEAANSATGKTKLVVKGAAQKAKGKVQKAVGKAKSTAKT